MDWIVDSGLYSGLCVKKDSNFDIFNSEQASLALRFGCTTPRSFTRRGGGRAKQSLDK